MLLRVRYTLKSLSIISVSCQYCVCMMCFDIMSRRARMTPMSFRWEEICKCIMWIVGCGGRARESIFRYGL